MDVLELPAIPKEKGKLQAAINEWRHRRKMQRLTRWAWIAMLFVLLYLVFVWAPGYRAAAQAAAPVPVPVEVVAPAPPAPPAPPAEGVEDAGGALVEGAPGGWSVYVPLVGRAAPVGPRSYLPFVRW
jgi:hypothetical protein